jgi:hypothetical protein
MTQQSIASSRNRKSGKWPVVELFVDHNQSPGDTQDGLIPRIRPYTSAGPNDYRWSPRLGEQPSLKILCSFRSIAIQRFAILAAPFPGRSLSAKVRTGSVSQMDIE